MLKYQLIEGVRAETREKLTYEDLQYCDQFIIADQNIINIDAAIFQKSSYNQAKIILCNDLQKIGNTVSFDSNRVVAKVNHIQLNLVVDLEKYKK